MLRDWVDNGYAIVNGIYTDWEIQAIQKLIADANNSNPSFRKSKDLFAIRRFIEEVPETVELIFNSKLKSIIDTIGEGYFVSKSIYFDKPALSNWFVAYHQDLTISVDKKLELEGFGPWATKQQQFSVQPPLSILENGFTIRIHLDGTDEKNGALKVIPQSHLKGIYRPETIDWSKEVEDMCPVEAGGIMLMKPLLLHSSARSTGENKRRVIHIEFNNSELPTGLLWSEKKAI